MATPVIADGTLYAVTGERGAVYGIDPTSGDVQWAFDNPQEPLSPPAVADGTLYVGCFQDAVCAIQ